MRVLLHDIVFALRRLRRDLVFAAGIVLTLGVCLGATTAIFSVVRSVLLRPLPYPEPERLVLSYETYPGVGVERAGTSVPNHVDVRAMTDVFDAVSLYAFSGLRVGEGVRARSVTGLTVSPQFFRVLRVVPAVGRAFVDDEGSPGRNHVAVVSHAFAASQAQPASALLGRVIRVDDVPHEVVGILEPDFTFLDPSVQVIVPIAIAPADLAPQRRFSQQHMQIARLATGVSLEQARARLDAFTRRQYDEAGSLRQLLVATGYATHVVAFDQDVVRQVRPAIRLLGGGVLLVMLIAAVNITTLSLVRATGRLRELATRTALGAATTRIVRQLVTEALVLTTMGAALGLVLGWRSLDALSWLGLAAFPRAHEIRMDAAVFAFVLVVAAGLAVVVGALPVLQVMHTPLTTVLRDEGRGGTASRRTRFLRRGFAIVQVALAFVLILGASLLFASFQRILRVNPGFVAERVLTGRLSPTATRYPDDASLRSYGTRVLERVRALPGVEQAGLTSYLPFSVDSNSSTLAPEGRVPTDGESPVSPRLVLASPGYLEALRIPIVRGRPLSEADAADAPPVVVIDEVLAERFWPGVDPIGKRVYQPTSPKDIAAPPPNVRWLTVVGVAAPIKMANLVEAGEDARIGAYYLDWRQTTGRQIGLAIRGRTDAPSLVADVRRAIAEIDPEVELFDVVALTDRIEQSLVTRRAPMVLTLAFGGVALLLAAIGLYGVLAYQVSQRVREFGIRLALGGAPRSILGLVLREGVWLVVAGLALGVAGAWMLRSAIASQLYGVGPFSPAVLLLALAVVVTTALVACLVPATRAARVNPLVALTDE